MLPRRCEQAAERRSAREARRACAPTRTRPRLWMLCTPATGSTLVAYRSSRSPPRLTVVQPDAQGRPGFCPLQRGAPVNAALSIRNYATHQVLDVAGHCLGGPMLLGAGCATLALIPRVDVRGRHVHPRRPRRSWQHEPAAAIAARLPLRMPSARRLAVVRSHVVHPVF